VALRHSLEAARFARFSSARSHHVGSLPVRRLFVMFSLALCHNISLSSGITTSLHMGLRSADFYFL
jgi:hypothetical protein